MLQSARWTALLALVAAHVVAADEILPVVSSVSTTLIPAEGGQPVTIFGSGFSQVTNATLCRFGIANVVATRLPDGDGLRCVAPANGVARGQATEIRLEFGLRTGSPSTEWLAAPPQRADVLLQGDAEVRDGELVLTAASQPHSIGSAWVEPFVRHAPLSQFELRAEVVLGGGGGAEGMSFCYAPPTLEPFGEMGYTNASSSNATGLVLRLLTSTYQRVELLLNGAMLASATAESVLMGTAFMPLRWQVDPIHGITVTYDEVDLLHVLLPPAWSSMPKASWRIGVGARTGDVTADHRVRSLRLSSTLLPEAAFLTTLAVSNDGLNFSSTATTADGGPHYVTYAPPPVVKTVTPLVGPIKGALFCFSPALNATDNATASQVSVEMALLHGGISANWATNASVMAFRYYESEAIEWMGGVHPQGGPNTGGTLVSINGGEAARQALEVVVGAGDAFGSSMVRFKFGSTVVPATANVTEGSIRCISPPNVASATVSVQISLNGQQYDGPIGGGFSFYAPAPPFDIHPPQGTTAGETNLTLVGIGLEGGVEYMCRVGYADTPATYFPSDGHVRCASPHSHLSLAPREVGRAVQQTYFGGLSLERSDDGALTLNFTANSTAAAIEMAAADGVLLELSEGASVKSGALRITDSEGIAQGLYTGSARATIVLPRPPLLHLSASFDLLITGPSASSSLTDYPYGFTLSFGGPSMPLGLSAPLLSASSPYANTTAEGLAEVVQEYPTLPANTSEEGGVRILLGYGEARDIGVSNQSISPYIRVVHAPSGGGPVDDSLHWRPQLALPTLGWRRVQMTILEGRLSLWLDEVNLLSELELDGWKPYTNWGLGFHGSRGSSSYHLQWIDNLHIASGSLRTHAQVPVFLSRNGQQFDAISKITYGYRMPPVVSTVSPHAGAMWDNTSITLHGNGFHGGYISSNSPHEGAMWDSKSITHRGDYRCVFDSEYYDASANSSLSLESEGGSTRLRRVTSTFEIEEVEALVVPASYNTSDGSVLCAAPPLLSKLLPWPSDGALWVNLSLSLNGVESGAPIRFLYINSTARAVVPSLGPMHGNVLIAIHGIGLSHGHDLACKFGESTHQTPATIRASDLSLLCLTPGFANANAVVSDAEGTVPVRLTLNGQDFNFANPPLSYTYYEPPVISHIHPPAGPSSGQTSLTLYGKHFGGASEDGLSHGPRIRCKIGTEIITAATSPINATDEMLVCWTPNATAAGGAVNLAVGDCVLNGTATLSNSSSSSGSDGDGEGASPTVLTLTANGTYSAEGACLLALTHHNAEWSVTSGAIEYTLTEPLYGAAVEFEASMELQLSTGGEGFSFAYADLHGSGLEALGGEGMGLRVILRTPPLLSSLVSSSPKPWHVAVVYDDVELTHIHLPHAKQRVLAATTASGAPFLPLTISYSRSARGGEVPGLTVRYNHTTLLRGMRIDRWAPQPTWRFGLASRAGNGHARCALRRVQVFAGGRVEPQQVPVRLTRNGQDYLSVAPSPFTYYGHPVISAITPPSGPLAGGTRLLFAGDDLVGGSDYTCRFGPPASTLLVPPSINTTRAAPHVYCVTPSATSSGVLHPQISLNGQDETNSSVRYRFYDPPAIHSISPTSGPSLGGTLVELHGANFTDPFTTASGAALQGTEPLRVCRYGPPMWDRNHGALSALLPSSTRVTGPHSIAYVPPHGLAPNEVYATVINATYALCVSPPSTAGEHDAVAVEISLNGHDFTDSSSTPFVHHFYAELPRIHHVFPISDSSAGGRLLTLQGHSLSNGSDTLCRFTGPQFGVSHIPATATADGVLVCLSPAVDPSSPLHLAEVPTEFPLQLHVSLNAQQYTPMSLDFSVIAGGGGDTTPALHDMIPTLGPVNGSTSVVVSGLRMQSGSMYLCKFGTSVVNASFDASLGAVRCFTPPHPAALVQVALSFNGEHYEPHTFSFTFAEEVELTEVSPASGPSFGVQCTSHACPGGASLGTLVTVSGVGLAAGLLPNLYRCKFNTTIVPATIAGAVVKCHSPSGLSAGPTPLRISLNAQDYSYEHLIYTVHQHSVVSSISPGIGPIQGGTNVTLHGFGLGGGSHYLCRFGDQILPATVVMLDGEGGGGGGGLLSNSTAMRCVTPPWADLGASGASHRLERHRAPIDISLNAQQWHPTALYFAYHHEPILSAVSPLTGPTAGTTALQIYGASLDGGFDNAELTGDMWATQLEDVRTRSHYACRFRNGSSLIGVTAAVWAPLPEPPSLRCDAPTLPASLLLDASSSASSIVIATIEITLDGVAYYGQAIAPGTAAPTFAYMVPPTLSELYPLSGPSSGGTTITISGGGFHPDLNLTCAFNQAIAEATIVDASTIHCLSPTIGHASPMLHQAVRYREGVDLQVRGGAAVLPSSIRLTDVVGNASSLPGTLLMPIPIGTPPLYDFVVSWLLLLPKSGVQGRAIESDGALLAFRYGPLPSSAPFGGEGALEGLSVSLSDGPPPLAVEVRLAGRTLRSRALGAPLPRSTWTRITIRCDDGVLSVFADNRTLVSALNLHPHWAPQRSWELGIGAHGGRPGRYVCEVRLQSSLIIGIATIPVQLQMQGQHRTVDTLNYTYSADAIVSEISPASGPTNTLTAITLHGVNFDLGLQVRCRLSQGDTVSLQPATLKTANDSTAEINCTIGATPWATGDVGVHVVLGTVDAHGPGGTFAKYDVPTLQSITPLVGVGESTVIEILGVGLDAGTDRHCRFGGEYMAPATLVTDPSGLGAAASLKCLAPQVAAAGDYAVDVTLNGAQYDAVGAALSFKYLTPGMVFVSSVTPSLGPLGGGTNVTVKGTNFADLPDSLSCSFGSTMVNATFLDTSTLLCTAPAVANVGNQLVQMSLNSQEFYGGAPFLYYPASGGVMSLVPSAKGRSGGGVSIVTLAANLANDVVQQGAIACRYGNPPCDIGAGGGGTAGECAQTSGLLVALNQIHCPVPLSPLAPDSSFDSRDVQLWVSVNGHQFTLGPSTFTYFEIDPEVHAVVPPLGPIHGSTILLIKGAGLTAGAAADTLCRFGASNFFGAPVVATKEADGSGLRCLTPQTPLAADSLVEVTLNGQDYINNASTPDGTFTYTLSGAASAVSPSSGPRQGGTTLIFTVLARPPAHQDKANGMAVVMLGNSTIPATFNAQGQLLGVSTPSPVGPVDVKVALNGQQFEVGDATFYYEYSLSDLMSISTGGGIADPPPPSAPPPNASALLEGLDGGGVATSGPPPPPALVASPLSGPALGGTTVLWNATFELTLATNLRCRFGAGGVAGNTAPATIESGNTYAARCISPPITAHTPSQLAAYDKTVTLGLSLNGQQYVDVDTFLVYSPAEATSLVPVEIGVNGGTQVNISGTLLGGGIGATRLCRFGERTVPATYDGGGGGGEMIRCVAPSADAIGKSALVAVEMDDVAALNLTAALIGDAALMGGAVRLAAREGWSFVKPRQQGALHLKPFGGSPALPYFEVRFEALMTGATDVGTGGNGGNGVGFSYGHITNPPALDEKGTGHSGLSIAFRSGTSNILEVRLNGTMLLAAPMGEAIKRAAWLPFRINVLDSNEYGAALRVEVGGYVLLDGLSLPSWHPTPAWTMAIAATTTDVLATSNDHWVHHVRVKSGSLLNSTAIPVTVSLNGQQFDPITPLSLTLLARPIISVFGPALGSTEGGTMLQVFGEHFGKGLTRKCRFSTAAAAVIAEVDATLYSSQHPGGDESRCVTPLVDVAHAGQVFLSITNNGLEYSEPPLAFTYHPPLDLTFIEPQFGPEEGGTLVRVYGNVSAVEGAHPICRFIIGAMEVPVPATFDNGGTFMLCRSPKATLLESPPLSLPSDATIKASFNAADFYGKAVGAPLLFTYTATATASGVTPEIGPSSGDTLVTVTGAHFQAANGVPQCRFGVTTVPATLAAGADASTTLHCRSPLLSDATGLYHHPSSFSALAASSPLLTLRGSALHHSSGDVVLLTNRTLHTSGAIILPSANPNLPPAEAPSAFQLTFLMRSSEANLSTLAASTATTEYLLTSEVMHWGGFGGFSVSYGELGDGGLGEYGAGNGLRISFRRAADFLVSGQDVVGVILDGRTIHEQRVAQPLAEGWRGGGYVPIELSHETSRGLSVRVRGLTLIDGLKLDEWFPQPGWSFGIGARCAAAEEAHWVRSISLRTGRLLTGGNLHLQVTLNGVDFDPGVRFSYFSVKSLQPLLGPTIGGTVVRVNGTYFVPGLVSEKVCRFGNASHADVVPASLVGANLECASPALPAGAAAREISISLDGGVNYEPAANFTFYKEPFLHAIAPTAGSRMGNMLVTIHGEFLAVAHPDATPLCRFGTILVDATSSDDQTLKCTAPYLSSMAPVDVVVSFNGQNFAPGSHVGAPAPLVWTPLDTLIVQSASPSSGPVHGGTLVTLHTQGIDPTGDLKCKFGTTVVDAVASTVGPVGTLLCHAPSITIETNVTENVTATVNTTSTSSVAAAGGGGAAAGGNNGTSVTAAGGGGGGGSSNATTNTTAAGAAASAASSTSTTVTTTTEATITTEVQTVHVSWPPVPLSVPVEVSANGGADFSVSSGVAYTYYQPPPTGDFAMSLVPPMGPYHGGALVVASGIDLSGGSDLRCRFGLGSVVNATAVAGDASALKCLAPEAPHPQTADFYISLNGQHWTYTPAAFTYATPAVVTGVLPDMSPNGGGLVVELSGSNLAGGSDYRCRFGGVAEVPATFEGGDGVVLCVSPPLEVGHASVAVTLNGQQYSHEEAPSQASMIFYDPDSSDLLEILSGEALAQAEVS